MNGIGEAVPVPLTPEQRVEKLKEFVARFKAHGTKAVQYGERTAAEDATVKANMDQTAMYLHADMIDAVGIDMGDPLQAQTVLGLMVMISYIQAGIVSSMHDGELTEEECDGALERSIPIAFDNFIHLALTKHGAGVEPHCGCETHE